MSEDRGASVISDLLRDLKQAQLDVVAADAERVKKLESKADKAELARVNDDLVRKTAQLQAAVDRLSVKLGRPGASGIADTGAQSLRDSARGLLEAKFYSRVTKSSHEITFAPSEDELAEAEHAVLAFKHLFKVTNLDQLPAVERKALTSFTVGSSGCISRDPVIKPQCDRLGPEIKVAKRLPDDDSPHRLARRAGDDQRPEPIGSDAWHTPSNNWPACARLMGYVP